MAKLRNNVPPVVEAANNLSTLMEGWLNDIDITMFRTCVTCANFSKDRTCLLFRADPPGSTIIRGCDRYVDCEETPF